MNDSKLKSRPFDSIREVGCLLCALVGILFIVSTVVSVMTYGFASSTEREGILIDLTLGWIYLIGSSYCFAKNEKFTHLLISGILLNIAGGSVWMKALPEWPKANAVVVILAGLFLGTCWALIIWKMSHRRNEE